MLAVTFIAGCGTPSGPTPVTRLEIYSVPLIVPACDGELTKWTVSVPETGASYSSPCEQAILLNNLVPYQEYNLEITGYSGTTLCWSGDCSIAPLPGLGIADCPNTVKQVCPDAGAP